jgi:hypothetical protein
VTEQELRMLVRDAIAQHTRAASAAGAAHGLPDAPFAVLRQHPSHGIFAVPAGSDLDGRCVIEPTVPCNHCGYCKSYGH